MKAGKASITAKINKLNAAVDVTVSAVDDNQAADDLVISPETIELHVGESLGKQRRHPNHPAKVTFWQCNIHIVPARYFQGR